MLPSRIKSRNAMRTRPCVSHHSPIETGRLMVLENQIHDQVRSFSVALSVWHASSFPRYSGGGASGATVSAGRAEPTDWQDFDNSRRIFFPPDTRTPGIDLKGDRHVRKRSTFVSHAPLAQAAQPGAVA